MVKFKLTRAKSMLHLPVHVRTSKDPVRTCVSHQLPCLHSTQTYWFDIK